MIRVRGRIVGEIRDGVLFKTLDGPRHHLHQPPAIAWAEAAISAGTVAQVHCIEALDRQTGVRYCLAFNEFLRLAFPVHRGSFEPQLAVDLDRWQTTRPGMPTQLGFAF